MLVKPSISIDFVSDARFFISSIICSKLPALEVSIARVAVTPLELLASFIILLHIKSKSVNIFANTEEPFVSFNILTILDTSSLILLTLLNNVPLLPIEIPLLKISPIGFF